MPVSEVIKKLMAMGEMASITQTLSDDAIGMVAEEFDKKIEVVSAAEEEVDRDVRRRRRGPHASGRRSSRSWATSITGRPRSSTRSARPRSPPGEAGGITQHIGAYQVHHDGKVVTFLDTPGHEAFTAMRARGAKVTDIAVIVVAADDGVMPQTTEAIDHAKAASVPIVIAVNKIDKENADPNRVRGELAVAGIHAGGLGRRDDLRRRVREDPGRSRPSRRDDPPGRRGRGPEGQPAASASGTVIESKLDPGRGPVATVIVLRGTLRWATRSSRAPTGAACAR